MEQTQPFDSVARTRAAANAVAATGKAASGETEASEIETVGGAGKAPSGRQARRVGWLNVRGIFWISPIAAGVLWGLVVLTMTQVQAIFPQSTGFNRRVHDGLLPVILGLPLLVLLGVVIAAFHLTVRFHRVWLEIVSVLAEVMLLVFLCLAAFAAPIGYTFHTKEPQATDIYPTGRIYEYTSPWDPNDGFVRVYREGLLLRYHIGRLDSFGNLLTAINHELKVADYPPSRTIESTNYAVVTIDKAGSTNHNVLTRPQGGIWQQVADLLDGGYYVACRLSATSRTLALTFQDTNGNHAVQIIPYPEQTLQLPDCRNTRQLRTLRVVDKFTFWKQRWPSRMAPHENTVRRRNEAPPSTWHITIHGVLPPLEATSRREDGEGGTPITIGNKMRLDANALVLPGMTIGDNIVVRTGSVVTRNLPANVITVGNPAQVYRDLPAGT